MVGPGLRKNPVYDILHGQPLRIHPDSQYQFMHAADVARLVWLLVEKGFSEEIFNVCGEGLVSPRQISLESGREMNLSERGAAEPPRVVNVSIEKIKRVTHIPDSRGSIAAFLAEWRREEGEE
jgi:nucleoside-diphosphate-sugar epimerase